MNHFPRLRVNLYCKQVAVGLCFFLLAAQDLRAQKKSVPIAASHQRQQEQLFALSKTKWRWMADKNTDSLQRLFHRQSLFVHMGGSWGKEKELEVIQSGSIWYKKAEVYSVTVHIIGNTAILLNDIDLLAVVGGNEVVNPFMVTEVYVREGGAWKMGSLTFSKLLRPVKMGGGKGQ